jgi:hypothetical protein
VTVVFVVALARVEVPATLFLKLDVTLLEAFTLPVIVSVLEAHSSKLVTDTNPQVVAPLPLAFGTFPELCGVPLTEDDICEIGILPVLIGGFCPKPSGTATFRDTLIRIRTIMILVIFLILIIPN